MAYLGVLEAVRGRLEGKPFRFTPPLGDDVAKAWGEKYTSTEIQNFGNKSQAEVAMELKPDTFTNIGSIKVPIYFFDIYGALQPGLTYPAFTYEVIDYAPRYDNFIWSQDEFGGDVYCVPVEGSEEPVLDEDGNNVGDDGENQARVVRQRAVEHPFDIIVEIRAYSRDPFESALLVKHIYERFPPRHFIRVPMRDGSFRSWDMLFEVYQDLDKREAVRDGTPGIEREYAKVWTYRVEGFFDNTDLARLVQLSRKRIVTSGNV